MNLFNNRDPNNDPKQLAAIGKKVGRYLETNPRIQKIENDHVQLYVLQHFLNDADCRTLIKQIDENAQPSTLYAGTELEGFRTSSSCHLDPWNDDVIRIENSISQVLGVDNNYSETMQGQRYEVGQQFKDHHDFFYTEESYWQQEAPRGGQRSWTAMIFLNEPEEGGETNFPQLRLSVEPKIGMLLIWNNMKLDGSVNKETLHAGTPVGKGTKHIVTKWFRQNNWRKLSQFNA